MTAVPNNEETEEIAGGIHASHPDSEVLPILVATATGKEKNTIRMDLIVVACWKLNDVRFAFASSFVLPATRSEFTELSALRKKHPGAPLSIFGHADPAGDDDFNKALSGHRAEVIYAVLLRDTAIWEKRYLAGQNEGWGISSIQHMLTATGHDPGPVTGAMNSQTAGSIKEFQSSAGLPADGVAGPQTRAKLFAAYMDFLSPDKLQKTDFLAQGAGAGGKGDYQGCGEFNPNMVFSESEQAAFDGSPDKSQRNLENSVNRRVMVLLYRPGTVLNPAKWPCPRVDEGVAGCRRRFWSDGEERRSPQAERREFVKTQDTFACRFYHRMVVFSPCEGVETLKDVVKIRLFDRFARPLPGAPCVVTEPGKKPRPMRATGTAANPSPAQPSPPASSNTTPAGGDQDALIILENVKVPTTINVKWSRPKAGDDSASPPPKIDDAFEFELDVTIELPNEGTDECSLTRLRNLGYVQCASDKGNIRAFQSDNKARFTGLSVDGILTDATVKAIRTVHEECNPEVKPGATQSP